MDKSAIDAIGTLAIDAAKANRLDTAVPALWDGKQVVSLEAWGAGRNRYRGSFNTSVLSEYVSYVKDHPGGDGFIDPKACKALTFLNLGSTDAPGHGDWTASLTLEPTAAYAALLAANGQRRTQRDVVEWVEDWAANLSALSGSGEGVSIAAALVELRSLKITQKAETTHTDRDMGATRTALEDIEASSASGIPAYLVFSTVPYLGLQSRSIRLRISIITGDKPAIALRIVGKEQLDEDIAQEFKQILVAAIGNAANLTIGSFKP